MLDQKEIQARTIGSSTDNGKKVDQDNINDMSDISGNAFFEAPEE